MGYSEHKIEALDPRVKLAKEHYEYHFPKKRDDQLCFSVWKEDDVYKIETGYFIGIDWIEKDIKHISVQPKVNFNKEGDIEREVDYLSMLFSCLKHSESANHISELIVVKWGDPQIEIEQKQDMLTPFIIMDFLNVIKKIVKKGLKKSYYKTTETLNGRVKGKLLIKQTMNIHLNRGNILNNVCSFDEFGVDNQENRLLKKALEYIKQYMLTSPLMKDAHVVTDLISFISPAFDQVSSDIEINEIKQMKSNTLFKEYDSGIRLAKLILKRFAYNITNTSRQKILTPPFWIDMPMLFELHILSLLKDRFKGDVAYHFSTYGNELDFLLKSDDYKMVIDAKYKLKYIDGHLNEDIRQVSGYARLERVYNELDKNKGDVIDCLIIYPDIENGVEKIEADLDLKQNEIERYFDVYKLGIKLPII